MLPFDELNVLYARDHEYISEPYDQYFGDMEISEEQAKAREKSARELEDVFLLLLAAILAAYNNGTYDFNEAVSEAQRGYERIAINIGIEVSSFFLMVHIPSIIAEIVDVTVNDPDKPFNFSIDRAILIAENEANSLWNDAEFQEAIESGYTEKTWHTMRDKRVRDTHRDVEGMTVPIMEPFEVGDSLMMYPRDDSLGAGMEEIANCRCSVSYS